MCLCRAVFGDGKNPWEHERISRNYKTKPLSHVHFFSCIVMAATAPRVYIACTVRQLSADALHFWLRHHNSMAVTGVVLRWEAGTMDAHTAEVLTQHTVTSFAKVLSGSTDECDDAETPEDKLRRTETFVSAALEYVRSVTTPQDAASTFLLHMEDDELLFCAADHTVLDAFAAVSITSETVVIPSLEAVRLADASECANAHATAPFYPSSEVLFRRCVTTPGCGRAAAKCSVAHIRPRGTHRFSGTPVYTMAESQLVVLHFGALDLPSWRAKFGRDRRHRTDDIDGADAAAAAAADAADVIATTPILPPLPYIADSMSALSSSGNADAATDTDADMRVFLRYRTVAGHMKDIHTAAQPLRRVHYNLVTTEPETAPELEPDHGRPRTAMAPPPLLLPPATHFASLDALRPPPLRVPPPSFFEDEWASDSDNTGCERLCGSAQATTTSDLVLL